MRIGVCDDNAADRQTVVGWLREKHKGEQLHQITEFSCGEALLEHLIYHNMDILYLDGKMTGADGLSVASDIRSKFSNTDLWIILLTDYPSYAQDGYAAGVNDFIEKSRFSNRADAAWDRAVKAISTRVPSTYTIRKIDGIVLLPIDQILYVESHLRKLNTHMLSGEKHSFYATNTECEKDLRPHGFIRPHTSFIVNGRHIVHFGHNQLTLVNGQELSVSRRLYQSAFDALTLYRVGVKS